MEKSIISPKNMENAPKGVFGYIVITETEPRMNKGGRGGVEPNPYYGRVTKKSVYYNAMMGAEYQNVVNNRRERVGMERDFEAEAPKGKKNFDAFFYQSLSDESKFYLKIGSYQNRTKIESKLFVDGVEATEEQVKIINSYLPPKSENKSQGLDEENVYRIVAPSAENVVLVKLGDRIFFERGENE